MPANNDAPQGPPPELPSFEVENNDVSYPDRIVLPDELIKASNSPSKKDEKFKQTQLEQPELFGTSQIAERGLFASENFIPQPLPGTPVRVAERTIAFPEQTETIAGQPVKTVIVESSPPVSAVEIKPSVQIFVENPSLTRLLVESETVQIKHSIIPAIEAPLLSKNTDSQELALPASPLELPVPFEGADIELEVRAIDDIVEPETFSPSAANNEATSDYVLHIRPLNLSALSERVEPSKTVLPERKILPTVEKATRAPTLPLTVRERMTQVFEVAHPQEKVKIAQLHVSIAHTVEKLQKLTGKEHNHDEQKILLQEELGELYEELLTNLDIEVSEEAVTHFVEAAVPDAELEQSLVDEMEVAQSDEGTHEHKLFALSLAKNLPKWINHRHGQLAKFIMGLTADYNLELSSTVAI